MSLFERIQKKIITESSSDTTGQNKKNKKKEFSSNISRTVKVSKDTEGLGNRQSRIDATDPKQGGYPRVDDTIDAEPSSGKTKLTDTTKGGKVKTYNVNKKNRPLRKGVDYFFDAEKAKKERDAFQQGRKAYTDSKSGIKAGKVTDKGVIDYITKARNMKQGTNANTKANREAAKVIAKSSGSEYKEKIRTKYETDKDLPRRRGKNQPSYAEVKKGIDAKNPTYKSPIKTVGKDGVARNRPLPLSTRKTKTKVKTPPPYKRIETKVTDKEIQDLIKKGKEAIPKKSTKVTPTKLANVDKAIKDLDDLIIGERPGEKAFTKKALKKQQRIITKKITTPSKKEIEQSQKILDKTQTKPKVKGNLFDPTGKIADQTKKAKQSFKQFMNTLKTKYPKPKLSLYDPLKNKIPNLEPLKPLKKPFIKPSITTKTATKSKALLPKLMKAVRKKPKGVVGLGLLALGTYGAIKNRIKTKTKTPPPNKNLVPLPNKDKVKIVPVPQTFNIVGDPNAKNDTFRKR
mgnify:FL=1